MRTGFIRQVLSESLKVWPMPGHVTASSRPAQGQGAQWRELQVHHQAERQGIPWATLNGGRRLQGNTAHPTPGAQNTTPSRFALSRVQDIAAIAIW